MPGKDLRTSTVSERSSGTFGLEGLGRRSINKGDQFCGKRSTSVYIRSDSRIFSSTLLFPLESKKVFSNPMKDSQRPPKILSFKENHNGDLETFSFAIENLKLMSIG